MYCRPEVELSSDLVASLLLLRAMRVLLRLGSRGE